MCNYTSAHCCTAIARVFAIHGNKDLALISAHPGMGALYSLSPNKDLGAYPGVGACPGSYIRYYLDQYIGV